MGKQGVWERMTENRRCIGHTEVIWATFDIGVEQGFAVVGQDGLLLVGESGVHGSHESAATALAAPATG